MAPANVVADPDEAALTLAHDILALHTAPAPISAQTAYRDTLFHGPAYQAVKVLTGLDPRGVLAEVRPSRADTFGGGPWLFDPGLLDAAAQLAWVWSAVERGEPALPNAIQSLTRLGTGDARYMVLRLRDGVTAPQVLADVAVADEDGTPLLLIEGLESTSDAGLARFSGWSGPILDDVQHDTPSGATGRAAE